MQIVTNPIIEAQTDKVEVKTSPLLSQPEPIDLGNETLLKTLHFIFDSFDGSGVMFFLLKDTAKAAIASEELKGDHLDIGVRKAEWNNGQMVLPHMEVFHVKAETKGDKVECAYEGVPFTIHLLPDSWHLLAPDEVIYGHENFKIPNRLDLFENE